MQFGALTFKKVDNADTLLAPPVLEAAGVADAEIYVSQIDPEVSDTAAFCERYAIGMDVSANCVVIEAKRADQVWYAACVILATSRADINGVIRKSLDARKTSFAPMEKAVTMTGMEFGAITPIGLPMDWPIFIDTQVAAAKKVIIGSGVRHSKLLVPGKFLGELPNASVSDITIKNKV
jgi:prolyl-tRNA editing enzyme YbaK/EbsC (Cys-tRNA(Pro) deacylase)